MTRALLVAGAQARPSDRRHAHGERAAERDVQQLDRHDDGHAGQPMGAQPVAHDDALDDDHDDLGESMPMNAMELYLMNSLGTGDVPSSRSSASSTALVSTSSAI